MPPRRSYGCDCFVCLDLGGGGIKKKQTVLSFQKPKKKIVKVELDSDSDYEDSDSDSDYEDKIQAFSSDDEAPTTKRNLPAKVCFLLVFNRPFPK